MPAAAAGAVEAYTTEQRSRAARAYKYNEQLQAAVCGSGITTTNGKP